MNLDITKDKHLSKIRNNIIAKYDLDFTVEELRDIVKSQFEDIVKYMEKEEEIKIDYIGKFKIKEGRRYFLDKEQNEE